jgi:hypothetical protein
MDENGQEWTGVDGREERGAVVCVSCLAQLPPCLGAATLARWYQRDHVDRLSESIKGV